MKWVVVAAGPSMNLIDMDQVRRAEGWNVLVVNCSFRLAPWAKALYAGDLNWWKVYGDEAAIFEGEKWTRCPYAALGYRLHMVKSRDGQGLCKEGRTVHIGGNSGYQAINLAWHFGAKKIILLGFDMHRRDGGHWHGEHEGEGMISAPKSHIMAWRRAFTQLAMDLRAEGVQVFNSTPGTALSCFKQVPLTKALNS